MSYSLYITRAPFWVDGQEFPILRDEWLELASRRSDLREEVSITFRGSEPEPIFEYICRNGSPVSLYWRKGNVVVTGVRDSLMAEDLVWLAVLLRASLMGDDGELYSEEPTTEAKPE